MRAARMKQRMRYSDRAQFCKNELARQIFLLMDNKQTNLALSADVTRCEELLLLADLIGPEICILKTHVDILEDFTPEFTEQLTALANQHQFFIFEDRKFADIGNTVKHQYEGGIYRIADWAHLINAHVLPGPGIISGLASAGLKKQRGLLLLAQMSSADNLFTPHYTEKTIAMAVEHPEFVAGFIAQKKLSNEPQWLHMTPGVQMNKEKDNLGQRYITPEIAIQENETDVIIVGRGIYESPDPLVEAKQYRAAGWSAYY